MKKRSVLFRREPQWCIVRKGQVQENANPAYSWLFEKGSLTQRLRDSCQEKVQVRVLFQQWVRPFAGESLGLSLSGHRYALIREVRLESAARPLIIARTVIPSQALSGSNQHLARLGERPLGDVLFSDPDLQRLRSELLLFQPSVWQQSILEESQADTLWGRRTLYASGERRMLVAEFFLPEVLKLKAR